MTGHFRNHRRRFAHRIDVDHDVLALPAKNAIGVPRSGARDGLGASLAARIAFLTDESSLRQVNRLPTFFEENLARLGIRLILGKARDLRERA